MTSTVSLNVLLLVYWPEANTLISFQLFAIFVPGDFGGWDSFEGNWNMKLLCLHNNQIQGLKLQCWVTWNRKKKGSQMETCEFMWMCAGFSALFGAEIHALSALTVRVFGKDVFRDVRGFALSDSVDGPHSENVLLFRNHALLRLVLQLLYWTRIDPHPFLCSSFTHFNVVATNWGAPILLWRLPGNGQEVSASSSHMKFNRGRRYTWWDRHIHCMQVIYFCKKEKKTASF